MKWSMMKRSISWESAGQALDRWLADPANQMALSALLRDLHTSTKGGARMAPFARSVTLAHELESLYEGLSDGRYVHSVELATLLQRSHDHLGPCSSSNCNASCR